MILDLFKLDGRVALVTGANRGLGQALTIGLAEAGADIAGVSRSGDDSETRRRVEALGRRYVGWQADLADEKQREGIADRVVRELGRIDILVNNAGLITRRPPEEYPLVEWHTVVDVHLTATFDLSQQAARHMLKRGRGKIVNLGSVLSFEGGLNIPAYTAAKHGIAGLTKSLAVAWSGKGINVNCIAPGYFDSNPATSLRHDPVRGPQLLDRIPCGRWGEPDELKGIIVFLASDASNYMHGSIVPIDGGWLAR
ncbi:MAG: SDR family oxidoreductase [Planctomycetales bacterium]|nr:SDR family oxidoreductase [Planctomycetales bacterium]